jgi:hypothetical protein
MEIKICTNCEFCWEGQDDIDSSNREPCPECGSTSRKFDMLCQDDIQFHEAWKGKIKDTTLPSKKKVRVEFFDGQEWSVAFEKFVNKVMVRDKRQNHYHEKVVDPDSGTVIHECTEPLSKHQNHGYAKFKKDNSKKP